MLSDAVDNLRQVAKISQRLPEMEAYIAKMLRAIEIRAYTAANSDRLSPEMAQTLWFEHKAAHDLLQKMRNEANMAQGQAAITSKLLEIGE